MAITFKEGYAIFCVQPGDTSYAPVIFAEDKQELVEALSEPIPEEFAQPFEINILESLKGTSPADEYIKTRPWLKPEVTDDNRIRLVYRKNIMIMPVTKTNTNNE